MSNVDKLGIAVVIIGLVIGALIGVAIGLAWPSPPDAFRGHCYSVTDVRGESYPSDAAPVFTSYGVVYRTDEESGVVTAAVAVRVDESCLATPTSVPVTPQPRSTPKGGEVVW